MTSIKFAQALKHVIDLAIDFDVHPSEIIEALEAKADELRQGRTEAEKIIPLSRSRGSI